MQRSFSDEFGNAINADLGLLQAAFVLILTYAALMLSKWDEGCVGSRVAVTFSGNRYVLHFPNPADCLQIQN